MTSKSHPVPGAGDKTVGYGFDKAGNRITLLHHGGGVTATYAYDTRDRCTAVGHNGATLADYTWLGSAMASRDTTCDYPGGTKPKFSAAFERDGLLRVTHLATTHQTLDQADSAIRITQQSPQAQELRVKCWDLADWPMNCTNAWRPRRAIDPQVRAAKKLQKIFPESSGTHRGMDV